MSEDVVPSCRVVLVNYKSLDNIRERLRSPALAGLDVLVVDNASDPAEIQSVCDEYGATAILLHENRGFAGGVNAAWAVAREREDRPLLLLNPDANLSREGLECLLAELQAPGTTGVGPLLVEASGRLQVGAAGSALSARSVLVYFLFVSHVLRMCRGLFLTRRQSLRGGPVAWVCMACLLLESKALDRYGYLPEDEIVYAEDVAWGTAATRAGAHFRLVPQVRVDHPHGASGASSQWSYALERLLYRRLGPVRGRVAVATMQFGLWLRKLLGRDVAR